MFKPTFLYIKQHTVTGKLYFGKTTQNPEKYKGSGIYWQNHINKHGKEHVVNLWYCLFYDEQDCKDFALNFSKQNDIVESVNWANQIFENGIDGGSTSGFGNGVFGKKIKNRKKISNESHEKMKTSAKLRIQRDGVYIPTKNDKQKISETLKLKYKSGEIINPMTGKFGEKHPAFGIKHSIESKQIRSVKLSGEGNGMYGKHHTSERNKHMSEKMTGFKHKQVECPHCHKIGGETSMKRWHFDKCKLKPILHQSNCELPPTVQPLEHRI